MAVETEVTLKLNSVALFQALRDQVGDWRLSSHDFNPGADELRISYDAGGSGRIALTVGFELDPTQMARLLDAARPKA